MIRYGALSDVCTKVNLLPMTIVAICLLGTVRPWTFAEELGAAGTSPLQETTLRKVRGISQGGAVIDLGGAGAFDEFWMTCPSVHYDGELYRMWYSSVYDNRMGYGGIGLVTSTDGVHWDRENDGEPVLRVGAEGAFDDGQILAPEVLFDGTEYRMWYTGSSTQWHSSGVCYYRVGLAVSHDGVHWQRTNEGNPVLDLGPSGSYDEVQAATPSVLRDAEGYRMWYAAWARKPDHTICSARSIDGIHWKRERDGKPIGGLYPTRAYGPKVCQIGDRYLLFYAGTVAPDGTYLFGAVSRDGFDWEMIGNGKPMISPGVYPDFDIQATYHPAVLRVGNLLRVWYTGSVRLEESDKQREGRQGVRGSENRLQIGLAETQLR